MWKWFSRIQKQNLDRNLAKKIYNSVPSESDFDPQRINPLCYLISNVEEKQPRKIVLAKKIGRWEFGRHFCSFPTVGRWRLKYTLVFLASNFRGSFPLSLFCVLFHMHNFSLIPDFFPFNLQCIKWNFVKVLLYRTFLTWSGSWRKYPIISENRFRRFTVCLTALAKRVTIKVSKLVTSSSYDHFLFLQMACFVLKGIFRSDGATAASAIFLFMLNAFSSQRNFVRLRQVHHLVLKGKCGLEKKEGVLRISWYLLKQSVKTKIWTFRNKKAV